MDRYFRHNWLIYLVINIVLSYIYLLNTTRDWDHFISAFTIDSIGFLENFKPIDWSYLMCGGVTRVGDPQSFSYSPLLIFPILLGGFWGSKVICIILFLLGSVSLDGLASDVSHYLKKRRLQRMVLVISCLYSSFLVSHITEGHITFIMLLPCISLVYLLNKIIVKNEASYKNYSLLSLIVFLIFSAGFYAALMYFLIPLFISLIIVLLINIKDLKELTLKFYQPILAILVGLLLSSPKIYGVISYQLQNPRVLTPRIESHLLDFYLFYFAPLIKYSYLGLIQSLSLWGSWEKTAFSPFIFLFLYFIFTKKPRFFYNKFKEFSLFERFFIQLIFTFGLIGFLLSLGDFFPYAPYSLLKSALNHSTRVPFRFSFIALFSLFTLFFIFVDHLRSNRKVIYIFGLLSIICLPGFFLNEPSSRYELYSRNYDLNLGHYNKVTFVPKRDNVQSNMYPAIATGTAVLNCYMPLKRDITVSGEFNFIESNTLKIYDFLFSPSQKDCLKNSYFNQEEIFIAKSCNGRVCLNFNGVNPKKDKYTFSVNKENKRLCYEN